MEINDKAQECMNNQFIRGNIHSMDTEPKDCPVCGGLGNYLGRLGLLHWFRCQDCGMEYNSKD